MRFSEGFRSSDKKSETTPTSKKRPAREMSNGGNYGYGRLGQVTSESRFSRGKKRREGQTPDSSFKFDRVPRKESETQGIASNARIDAMRRRKEDTGRGIRDKGDTATGRTEYRLRNTESGLESEAGPEKLTSEEWDRLDKKLSEIESAFDTFKGDNYNDIIADAVSRGEQDKLGELIEQEKEARSNKVNDLLDKFRKAVQKHLANCHDDNYDDFNGLLKDIPASTEDPEFRMSLRICDGVIRTGKGEEAPESDSSSQED